MYFCKQKCISGGKYYSITVMIIVANIPIRCIHDLHYMYHQLHTDDRKLCDFIVRGLFVTCLPCCFIYLFNFIASLYLIPIGLIEIQVTLASFKNILVQISLVSTLFFAPLSVTTEDRNEQEK